MSEVVVEIAALHPEMGKTIPLPRRMSEHAAGMDLAAALDDPVTLRPGERQLIPCGFRMALPQGYEAQIRPRSGLAVKHGIGLLNAPGTIDADYRGEVRVILINHGEQPFVIERGMRIAQMVIAPVVAATVRVTADLAVTARGDRGFGSTDTKDT
ncbi:MAG: deoxyuridine 5'-triphosphate nucleotidohydrolase [Deltaproteobacteria bacterium RIFOXYA12_FULL_58_15]|nr:MAG: deoxyuridine 5'-triphosphate nucleotidohydrolase [Deltaproteobacteria bacterium RIFOXYA12_FULL_58_15]OGR09316.1 MAG: deoxyuridine 5'-triphosphate nucleotidohydrolase [Deltaproteobacteria bacterium RIFOXYB12_FULL_58_9]